MSETSKQESSPRWGTNTKLVVALTLVVIIGGLLVKFQYILSPLMISVMLAYLLYPPIEILHKRVKLSWGISTGTVYLLVVILLISLLAWGGVSLIQQGQSVLTIITDGLKRLPELTTEYSTKKYDLIFMQLDLSQFPLSDLGAQAIDMITPAINQTGTLLSSVASGAANLFGWTLFVIFVSYFIVAESGGSRSQMINVELPGYTYDIARLMRELSRIWNAFLRGQISIFFMTILIYIFVLELLGVRYAITLAFIAGIARFLPYIGPAINWVILALITYFQEYHLFGMSAFTYTVLVLAITIIIDMAIDYIITPRIYSDTLAIHPAAVLVAAIIAATLFGVLGVVVAAPILASALLLWQYTTRKLLDMDPWQQEEQHNESASLADTIRAFFSKLKLNLKTRK